MNATSGNVKCSCGSTRFVYYQTITEAADVRSFDENGAAVLNDKWEVVDVIEDGRHDSEIRCENGHQLQMAPHGELPTDGTQWNGDVL